MDHTLPNDPAEREPESATPERRTVGLEVITDKLRAASSDALYGGRVGIVCRVDGQVVDVPELDTLWEGPFRKPADVLSILLRQARHYADEGGAELLMPNPDVLAALAGQPELRPWSELLELRADQVKRGWLVADFSAKGVEDLVENVDDCDDATCPWTLTCVVITARDVEPVHFATWHHLTVRIPAVTR